MISELMTLGSTSTPSVVAYSIISAVNPNLNSALLLILLRNMRGLGVSFGVRVVCSYLENLSYKDI